MLTLTNIQASYEGSRILRDVSLKVAPGQVVCLMGRNGVGKTTTLKAIMGLVQADSGSVKLGDAELTSLKPDARARHGLGYVPQGRDIFPNLTVMENLRIGAVAQGKKLNGEVERVFSLFPILKEMTERKGGVLSGGQQQQLAIGRALVLEPTFLILDEPTEGIQPNIVHEIGDTMVRLNRDLGMTILLVEQKLPMARRVADRFTVLDKGRVVASGAMDELDDGLVRRYLTV